MRAVVWLSLPVLVFCSALLFTLIMNWTRGVPLCTTWLRAALPFCN